jgi:uncharacterized protein (DUF2237 family)
MTKNVFGEPLIPCSENPMTGYFRDGCCKTTADDIGTHTVCAVVTEEFLQFSSLKGNDLITPRPEYLFPGLQPDDRWCLCVSRWLEAYRAGVAPCLILEATHEKTLAHIELAELVQFAYKNDTM